jgi:hypothetical protein
MVSKEVVDSICFSEEGDNMSLRNVSHYAVPHPSSAYRYLLNVMVISGEEYSLK